MKKGIDVSSWNGKLNWNKLKDKIDFAIIRAGLGQGTEDTCVHDNIKGCIKNGIPFGLYWFSYAIDSITAEKEADYLCNIADKYKPTLPLAFDFEYDSDNYAKSLGYSLTNNDRYKIAISFLNRVKKRGYIPMIYTNPDYINKGFKEVINHFDLWLASWGVDKPPYSCSFWQYNVGKISGMNGDFDLNYCYIDITDNKLCDKFIEYFNNKQLPAYTKKISQVFKGDLSSGTERKKLLREQGFDYELTQHFINGIIDDVLPNLNNYIKNNLFEFYLKRAKQYKNGDYGNDKSAKKTLNTMGYDFEMIKYLASLL